MGKGRFRSTTDIALNGIPVTLIIADIFAGSTDRKQSAQLFHIGKGCLQL
jgi:hypothetical protein